MNFEIFYIISGSFYVVTTIYTLYRLKKVIDMRHEHDIRKQFIEYVHSKEFRDLLVEAINQSDINQKLNVITLALCTHVPELKKSKLCQEGI